MRVLGVNAYRGVHLREPLRVTLLCRITQGNVKEYAMGPAASIGKGFYRLP